MTGPPSIEFTVPGLRIVSEMNTRDHWSTRHRRFKSQRRDVWGYWHAKVDRGMRAELMLIPPKLIRLTRLGPKLLDKDNLAGGLKACIDELAALVGVDDARLTWEFAQEKASGYALRIEVWA